MSPRFLLGHASFRCGPRFFGLSPCSQSPAATRDNGSSLDELPQGVIRGGRRGRTCNSLSAPDFTFRLPRHMAGSPCLSIPGHFPTIISLLITDRIGQHWPRALSGNPKHCFLHQRAGQVDDFLGLRYGHPVFASLSERAVLAILKARMG